MEKFNRKYNLQKVLKNEAIDLLLSYDWPGNVRELENIIERLIVTTNSNLITYDDLLEYLAKDENKQEQKLMIYDIMPLKVAFEEVERQLIIRTMRKYGNTYKAAEILKISQPSAARKAKKYFRVQN